MADRGVAKKKSAAGRVLYLYGITRGRARAKTVGAEGIDGESVVEAVNCGGFTCWVSRVPKAGFADSIADNMESLEWLAVAGVRHQRAVSEIAENGSMVPARFGTVFSGEKALTVDVTRRKKTLNEIFDRVEDCDEWGVKVFAQAPAEQPTTAASGKDYLAQKAARLRAQVPRKGDEQVAEMERELKQIARDSAATGKVSGSQPDLVWQATFLLPRRNRKRWNDALRKYAQRWGDSRSIECTGPWPPYSFVSEDGR